MNLKDQNKCYFCHKIDVLKLTNLTILRGISCIKLWRIYFYCFTKIIEAVSVTLIITYVGIIISVIEVLFDYSLYSLSNYHWAAVLEVIIKM